MNRLKGIFSILLFIPIIAFSQEVQIDQSLNWEEVLSKAKQENKYIFLDCYATWCLPCKKMEKDVYPNAKAAEYMNPRFVSVKVQIDTGKADDQYIKSWYNDAHKLQERYSINSYPTFLFFSPEGEIVHKAVGYVNINGFLALLADATDTSKQYYTLLENYRRGKKDYAAMPHLLELAKSLNDKKTADSIAQDYVHNYLNNLKEKQLLTKKNLGFFISTIPNSNEKAFDLFYHHAAQVDSVWGANISQSVVNRVVSKEEIYPRLYKDGKPIPGKPVWADLITVITKKYSAAIAKRTVLDAKIRWFTYKEDWQNAIKYNVEKIEVYGLDTSGFSKYVTNDMIYTVILMHCDDRRVLTKALNWMEVILKADTTDASNTDTYANLLYKLGKTSKALEWEEKAVNLFPENTAIQDDLSKMKAGLPTWK